VAENALVFWIIALMFWELAKGEVIHPSVSAIHVMCDEGAPGMPATHGRKTFP
jgi:hypothetical protein